MHMCHQSSFGVRGLTSLFKTSSGVYVIQGLAFPVKWTKSHMNFWHSVGLLRAEWVSISSQTARSISAPIHHFHSYLPTSFWHDVQKCQILVSWHISPVEQHSLIRIARRMQSSGRWLLLVIHSSGSVMTWPHPLIKLDMACDVFLALASIVSIISCFCSYYSTGPDVNHEDPDIGSRLGSWTNDYIWFECQVSGIVVIWQFKQIVEISKQHDV